MIGHHRHRVAQVQRSCATNLHSGGRRVWERRPTSRSGRARRSPRGPPQVVHNRRPCDIDRLHSVEPTLQNRERGADID
ncbi:hypothetical protein J6590_025041 [Homalodisca vitripennis]|nr:hypothetical protein J6590_025041 [Homalodisca vitripennis]